MPRIRTIKPDFFTSDTVSELPLRARLTWIGLWTHCDDYGRCRDNVKLIKAAIWPLDNVSLRDIDEDLDILTARGRLIRYTVDGKNYLAVPTWTEHQRVSHPAKSRIPAPPESALELLQSPPEDYRNGPEDLPSIASADPVDKRPEAAITQLNAHSGNTPESSGGFPEASGNPPLGKGKEQGTGKGNTRGTEPPPPKCQRHIDDDDPPPCGPCADARRVRETWDRDEPARLAAARSATRSEQARTAATATAAAIAACDMCDHAGYRPGAVIPCDHDPDTLERASRGAALARATLLKGRTA